MEGFTNFLVNNYIWFLIVALILIFALIGYLVDTKEDKLVASKKDEPKEDEVVLISNEPVVQEPVQNEVLIEEDNPVEKITIEEVAATEDKIETEIPKLQTIEEPEVVITQVEIPSEFQAEEKVEENIDDIFAIDEEASKSFETIN